MSLPNEKLWLAAPTLAVGGVSGLSCEAKIVADWFRIFCHGKNAKGGSPHAVTVIAKSDEVKRIALYEGEEGVALLLPYQAATHLEAVFEWTDGNRKLTLDWPATSINVKAVFTPYTGEIKQSLADIQAHLDHAPLTPVRLTVEDLKANPRAYAGKVVFVIGWQNGSVDNYMGIAEGLYPDEDNLNDIFFKTSELPPDQRKMLMRGACHVAVVGLWEGGMIDTFFVRVTTGAENGARINGYVDDEVNRLRAKGF